MNLRYYSTLHLCIHLSNRTALLLLLCAFHSHNLIFNNEQSSYSKLNVKQTLAYMYAEQGILSRCLLKMTWIVFKFIKLLHLQTMLVFYVNFRSEINNNPKIQLKYTIGSALHAVFTITFPIFKSQIFYFFCSCF